MKKVPNIAAMQLIQKNLGGSLPILNYGVLKNGTLRTTDLDHQLKVFTGLPGDGLVDIALYVKGDLQSSINAAKNQNQADFPEEVSNQPETALSPEVLKDLNALLPALLEIGEKYIQPLNFVCVNHTQKEAVATNGHILLLQSLKAPLKESFLIDELSIKITEIYKENVTGFSIWHKKEGKKKIIDSTFLKISGDGWELISKVSPFSTYPQYQNVIPDRPKTSAVHWNDEQKNEVNTFLKQSLPFLEKSKHYMVYFTNSIGIAKNNDLSYIRKTDFSIPIFLLYCYEILGMNAKLLQNILKFVNDRPATVTTGRPKDPVIWTGEDFLALQMPLLTYNISEAELLTP